MSRCVRIHVVFPDFLPDRVTRMFGRMPEATRLSGALIS